MPSTVSNHYGDLENAPTPLRREGVANDGDFVRRQRSLGRSWQTISTMLGRSVLDLRRAFDPSWSDSWASAPVVTAPKPARAATGLSSRRLRLLDAIEGGAVTSRAIADRLETDSSSVSTELNRMRGEGLIRSDSGSGAPFGRGARLRWALERPGALMLIKARRAARG